MRSLQRNYSYENECLSKYGGEVGGKIWELTNRIFDALPLCAVIDGAVFCAHGGIPRAATHLEEVAASLPAEIAEPQHESTIAWEILWSGKSFTEGNQLNGRNEWILYGQTR